MKQTKIVCSISDRRCDVDFLRKLFFSGMNVVRMNTAHASPEGIKEIIRNTRAVSQHLALLIDTKGPEVRTTAVAEPIHYKVGDMVKIFGRPDVDSTKDIVNVSYPDFARDVKVGDHVLFDDGALDMQVIESVGPMLVAQVQNEGDLGSHKSVNVPGEHIELPALTEKDKSNILLAIEEDIDFIAHSFVRSAADVHAVQKILDEHNSDIKIISKIENQEGVDNIDEIIDASYGIMIARGDLGIEVPIEQIPGIQRSIINKCILKKKPVIVATQMLSGETASGKYPVEAVQTMARIAEAAEQDAHKRGHITVPMINQNDQREFLSRSAIEATEQLGVKGIITDSETGQTARNLAAFRGPHPVLAICYKDKVQRWLNLSYGVIAIYQHRQKSNEEMFTAALRMLRQKGYIELEDKIAYLSGSFGAGGGTSFLEINNVGDVFARKYRFHLPEEVDEGEEDA